MAQIFHRSTNTLSRLSIYGAAFFLAFLGWAAAALDRSAYITEVRIVRDQPVPFSHKHHVGGLGLDCRYCHTSVEQGPFAGMPPTKTCMTCHSILYADSPMLEPVRESFRTGKPLPWVRVHDLPDFVYFDHSIHVNKGVSCATCHGAVNEMPLMWREHSLKMEWCLDCHRNPQKFLNADAHAVAGQSASRIQKHPVKSNITNCSVCHR